MSLGDRRHRVTFQSLPLTSDGQGGGAAVPTTIAADVPCAVDALTRAERVQGGQLTSVGTHLLRVDARADLRVKHRALVTYADTGLTTTFQIEAIDRAGARGEETHVFLTAVQS